MDPEVEAAVNKAAQAESSVVDVVDSEKSKRFLKVFLAICFDF